MKDSTKKYTCNFSWMMQKKVSGAKSAISKASGATADVLLEPGEKVFFGNFYLEVSKWTIQLRLTHLTAYKEFFVRTLNMSFEILSTRMSFFNGAYNFSFVIAFQEIHDNVFWISHIRKCCTPPRPSRTFIS